MAHDGLDCRLVILSENTEPQLEDPPPPFLQEPGYLVDHGAQQSLLPRALEMFDRWRPGLLVVFAPLVVAAIGLAYFTRPSSEPAGEQAPPAAGQASAFESLVSGVSDSGGGGDADLAGRDGNDGTGPGLPSPLGGDLDPRPPSTSTAAAPTTAGVTVPSTVSTTEPTTTTTEPTTTTTDATTTTAPQSTTTTEPTTTTTEATTTTTEPDICTATVSGSATLRAEPHPFSQDVGQVSPGDYPLLDTESVRSFFYRATWYQLDADGTVGWVEGQNVSSTQGNCGGN